MKRGSYEVNYALYAVVTAAKGAAERAKKSLESLTGTVKVMTHESAYSTGIACGAFLSLSGLMASIVRGVSFSAADAARFAARCPSDPYDEFYRDPVKIHDAICKSIIG